LDNIKTINVWWNQLKSINFKEIAKKYWPTFSEPIWVAK
jgi:hypothetical protein